MTRLVEVEEDGKKVIKTDSSNNRRVANLTVGQAKEDFKNLAYYFTLSTITDRLGEKSEKIAEDVLKAWSFYLSLRNWHVANEQLKAKATSTDEKYDPRNAFKLITDYLTTLQEEGSRAAEEAFGKAITDANAARAALDAAKFNKQRYLIENIDELSKLSIKRDKDSSSSTQLLGVEQNRILRLTNSKKNAVNKLTGAASGREMFKLPNIQLSKFCMLNKEICYVE